ncbi:Type II toxin-antitoxin system PemK/MazF family toxin (plasmid) [Candidatus Trichorickettsia mobilis]|uniref:Type II toxin-antitoxin system PemK/MazF family toxin n=1 Tax=Candidatus Trichorickettsia mobilis TaxID=1346319 RepID=A0ABZ0UVC9_9RICK|nr:type II toxin-antitoxin system PemK/MazF family toxin [Candidatus Trichorickettsia mobilis]WPY01561.1 Type II toxin-antitoxin system PemK/MazF family toxin [Candidatus Trichorickettsia mobilis]
MIYNKFDIVKVSFPFTDKAASKKRPALVISSSEYQINYEHCILAMITSTKQTSWKDDINIVNLEVAGLPSASKIRLKIFSLDCSLILAKLGCLADEEVKSIIEKLKKYI